MSLFKCKMCGGTLEIQTGSTVAECEYCGAKQTLPKLDDEKRVNLYDRANHFRRNNDFDKASAIYEQILNEDGTDSEAYWSLVLCRYGIEYVEDPSSHKRVPTVHRAQYTSIFDDDNYKMALQNADTYQKIIYEQEAKAINEIQKGILAISGKEEPFDVFICYKETDNSGNRTHDSVLAQELYYQLTQEGFKVFFARITLEDKLGSAYEPYIFAALNSAKVMVVLGTKPEFFNAVWVKNEWSRFLSLIKNGAKKTLIPAYRDMDPYDLPQEFSHLQAQDMSKLGFMQDLIRGINKIAVVKKPQPTISGTAATIINENTSENPTVRPLLKRMMMFLEDGEWSNADEYCEKILDIDPECSKAYAGKLMAKAHIKTMQELHKADFSSAEILKFYDKACKFSNPDEYDLYKSQYNIYEEKKRDEQRRREEKEREEQIRREEEQAKIRLSKFYIGTVQVSQKDIQTIDSMMQYGRTLETIKYVRDIASLGLGDAKAWVENYKSYDLHSPQPQFEPTSFYDSPPTTLSVSDPEATLSYTVISEIEALEKKHKKQIIWACIGLIYWPVAVVLFICAARTKSKIKALKSGTSVDVKLKPLQLEKQQGGCYIATCVYGSYDCPQVWTLRRYRDNTLGATWHGRLFIRTYYATSPTLVKLFGKTKWFKKMWKGKLDHMVKKLQDNGVASTPYKDKDWN